MDKTRLILFPFPSKRRLKEVSLSFPSFLKDKSLEKGRLSETSLIWIVFCLNARNTMTFMAFHYVQKLLLQASFKKSSEPKSSWNRELDFSGNTKTSPTKKENGWVRYNKRRGPLYIYAIMSNIICILLQTQVLVIDLALEFLWWKRTEFSLTEIW